MRRPLRLAALALLAAAACKEEPRPPPSPAPVRPAPPAFTVRDLALATALDARLARLTLVAFDIDAAAKATARDGKDRATRLLPQLRIATAEVERAVAAIANPADRAAASRAGVLASRLADELAAAVGAKALPSADVNKAQGALGEEIDAYRRSRARWRLETRDARGDEREFDEARQELERLESPQGRRVAPATVREAVRRATAAAERLGPELRAPAARYASAQEKALVQVRALGDAVDEHEGEIAARAYVAAKVDALSALADYYALVSAR